MNTAYSHVRTRTWAAISLALLLPGCCAMGGSSEDSAMATAAGTTETQMRPPDPPPHPDKPLVIEESDILKVAGSQLYVLNERTGLHSIDVSEPRAPRRVAQVEALAGTDGELYVRGDALIALVGDSGLSCGRVPDVGRPLEASVTVAGVVDAHVAPQVLATNCLPGTLVSSRLVGDILYVVTTDDLEPAPETWVFSMDASEVSSLRVVESMQLVGGGEELHVTDSAIYITQPIAGGTTVRYVDISTADGCLVERGSTWVEGEPMGRFHMDEYDETFRIVTRNVARDATALHVIDVTYPDSLRLISSLPDIAPGEELFATRFDGKFAYVVTYEPTVVINTITTWGGDPLWVISLSDPEAPEILGELHIPGWSDFVFPRGDRLLAVGRGERGDRVAASLFDVSDPTAPAELQRLEFGEPNATSEASSDFRGVRVIENELGSVPLLVVPYSNNRESPNGCVPDHHVQLVDLYESELGLRGNFQEPGRVLRTLPIEQQLYAVSTKAVSSNDVSNRDDPRADGLVVLDGSAAADACVLPPPEPMREETVWVEAGGGDWSDNDASWSPCGCTVAEEGKPCWGRHLWWLLGAGLLAARLRAARRRRTLNPLGDEPSRTKTDTATGRHFDA